MKAGYAPIGASANGLGPFFRLFSGAVNLRYANSLEGLDAIVLWGGDDISPSLYDEEPYKNSGPAQPTQRDTFEWSLIKEAEKLQIPVIGICRGAQLMCAYVGGKLVQDVNNHGQSHPIKTSSGERFLVTSCHHQMMVPWNVDHELLAWSETHQATRYLPESHLYDSLEKRLDKEPEVVFFPQIKGYAIQCHPEWHGDGVGKTFNDWVMQDIVSKCFKE